MVQSISANLFIFESITHKGITCRAQRNGFWIRFSCFRFICHAIGLTLQRGVKMLPWGRGERVRFLMGNFDCAPVRSVAVVTLERSQSLISNCAVVEKTGTRCSGKLKAPVVMHKSFELERKGWSFFQADQTRRKMNFPSLRRKGKSSRGFEFWRENGLAARLVRNGSVQPWLRLMKATTKTSKPPKNDEIAQKDNRNQERWVHFLYFIEKKVKFYFVERFYSTLF